MPKIVDRDLYRKELLGKCFDLFASKGYASITMREIAQKLGVSTGTLYHYFPSKEALFEQLVEELYQQDMVRVAAELEKASSLAERIEAAFDFIAKNEDYLLKQMLISMDFYQQQGREKVRQNQVFKRIGERARSEIANLLGIEDTNLVIFVLALIDGLILARLYHGETLSLASQGVLLKNMIMAYLKN